MPDHVYKSVDITGSSPDGVTEAINSAVAKATKTLRHIGWFEVENIRGFIGEDKVNHFQVTMKIGFRLED
jgi:dodecin